MTIPNNHEENKNTVLIVATLAAFLTPFMSSSINIALPAIGKEFGIDAILLSWIATSYLLTTAMFLVPLGKLSDSQGRKKIFTWGLLLYSLSSFLCAISTSVAWLLCFRVLQGIGSAMLFSTGTAIVTSVFTAGERGKALGINVGTTYLGLSLGPVLGGWLTQHFGWRSIFLSNVPLGLIALVLVFWKIKGEWAEAQAEGFDFAGSLIYSISLLVAMYGLSLLPAPGGAWLVGAGILGILVFVWWENKIANPVLNIELFRKNKIFTFSNLAALINYSATSAVGFLLSLYLQYIKMLTPQEAGWILIFQPAVMAFFSPIAGRLSDKIEARVLASSGMAIITVGLVLLAFLKTQTTLVFITVCLILLGFGFALFSSPNTNAIMSSVEKQFYGVAAATLATMRLTGQLLSMGIVMLIFAVNMGKVQLTPAYYPQFLLSTKTALIIFAVLCFLGIFASLARGFSNTHHFNSKDF